MPQPYQPAPQFSDTVKGLISFLRRPRPAVDAEHLKGEADHLAESPAETDPFRMFIHLLGLSLLLSFGAMMLMGLLREGGLLPEFPHSLENMMKDLPFFAVVFFTTVLAPVLEELTFRLWLVYKPVFFGISACLICVILFSVLRPKAPLAGYIVLAFAGFILMFLLSARETSRAWLQQLYSQYYGWLFYGASILFALIHLFNYQASLHMLLFTPVLVLPQLLLGLVLGYLRVQLGIAWAIALHAIYNGLILSLAYKGMQAEPSSIASCLSLF